MVPTLRYTALTRAHQLQVETRGSQSAMKSTVQGHATRQALPASSRVFGLAACRRVPASRHTCIRGEQPITPSHAMELTALRVCGHHTLQRKTWRKRRLPASPAVAATATLNKPVSPVSSSNVSQVGLKDAPLKSLFPDEPLPPAPVGYDQLGLQHGGDGTMPHPCCKHLAELPGGAGCRVRPS